MLEMTETQEQKKKRKKQHLSIIEQGQEETAIQNAKDVAEVLEELVSREFNLIFRFAPDVKALKLKERKAQAEICGRI